MVDKRNLNRNYLNQDNHIKLSCNEPQIEKKKENLTKFISINVQLCFDYLKLKSIHMHYSLVNLVKRTQ